MPKSHITDAIREAIYPFNNRVEVITALIEVLYSEQRAHHKSMEKQMIITDIVEGLRLKQITSKAAKRKQARRKK